MEWVDDQVDSNARLASEVRRLLSEMRLEQELVALRERRGLSQREAAKLIHATQPYVAKLESGRIQNLGVATLVKYAHALGGRLTIDIKAKRAARRSLGAGTTRRSARPRGVVPGRKRRR
jgi:transcriptional regulator with XRE-family HTH domain